MWGAVPTPPLSEGRGGLRSLPESGHRVGLHERDVGGDHLGAELRKLDLGHPPELGLGLKA